MDNPEHREMVLIIERGRYDKRPPRYSRQWCLNVINLPLDTLVLYLQILKGRLLYRT